MNNKKGMSVTAKQRVAGWAFLTPASLLIFILSFYPMIQALLTSFKTGSSANMTWAAPFYNYQRMFQDKLFLRSVGNTFLYLIIQVPVMLILAILLAQILNNKDLKFKGLFRTMVFLPCATSLVSYALIFKRTQVSQLINQYRIDVSRHSQILKDLTGILSGRFLFSLIRLMFEIVRRYAL